MMFECSECENEFKVVTKATDPVTFCPICGATLDDVTDLSDDDDDDDEGFFEDDDDDDDWSGKGSMHWDDDDE